MGEQARSRRDPEREHHWRGLMVQWQRSGMTIPAHGPWEGTAGGEPAAQALCCAALRKGLGLLVDHTGIGKSNCRRPEKAIVA